MQYYAYIALKAMYLLSINSIALICNKSFFCYVSHVRELSPSKFTFHKHSDDIVAVARR